uniref:Putative secreted protein n=1 Tax=Anopheles darlingi TaxID=43151 RepID=A0A2M4DPI7_ANODA
MSLCVWPVLFSLSSSSSSSLLVFRVSFVTPNGGHNFRSKAFAVAPFAESQLQEVVCESLNAQVINAKPSTTLCINRPR